MSSSLELLELVEGFLQNELMSTKTVRAEIELAAETIDTELEQAILQAAFDSLEYDREERVHIFRQELIQAALLKASEWLEAIQFRHLDLNRTEEEFND